MAIKSADQITIIDVTDAYSVTLSSETYTFVGGTSGAASGQSCTTEAFAFCGSNMCSSITVDKAEITCPTGISATVENSGSSKVKITFTTTATITSACEATIPIKIGEMTFNKKFSFAVAKTGQTGQTGATGVGVKSVVNKYLTTSASEGVTISTSGWSDKPIPTNTTNKYMWIYQIITYTNNTTSTTVPAIAGTHGATGGKGDTGVGVKSVVNKYLTTSASEGVTVSTSGWSDNPTPTSTSKRYMWSYQVITYTNNTTSTTVPALISTHGATGHAGADAISLTITSSNGTVFKNSTGTTVLTAHVYKGGTEQAITDAGAVSGLGTVKWYKGTSTTPVATAKTLTVSAVDVISSQVYTCQLE